jgi:peptide/nickel transport system substrate-binding protein
LWTGRKHQPDQQTALVAFESGLVDWVTGVSGQDARRLESNPACHVLLTGAGGNYYYVGLDTSLPALADKRVRQAFSYAVNRQRIVDSVLAGYGRPASTIWPPQSPGYDADLPG